VSSPALLPMLSSPQFNGGSALGLGFAPADFYTFYDETLAAPKTLSGAAGQCIGIYGGSDTFNGILDKFTTSFGLSSYGTASYYLHRVNVDGSAFGIYNAEEPETLLDVEWAHTIAPTAPIRLYLGSYDLTTALSQAVAENLCSTIGIGYYICGATAGFFTGTLNSIFARAAAQGI
jgi:subtilase family serine protease